MANEYPVVGPKLLGGSIRSNGKCASAHCAIKPSRDPADGAKDIRHWGTDRHERAQLVVMRTAGTRHTAETSEDLSAWVRQLTDCPKITQTTVAICSNAAHGDEPATWFYVEADAEAGVARLRCLSGGHVNELLDSGKHWTFPHVWACVSCGQSIAEVVYGIHDEDFIAKWLVVAVRCVECGDVAGVTDIVTGDLQLEELLAKL
jgi:hypothetical protein